MKFGTPETKYKDARLCVTGKITSYRGKPEIIATEPSQVFTGSAYPDALGINLSDFGMCLFTIANMPLGSEVQVEFLPPRCKRRVRVCGRVRYRALYLYGIEFLVDSDHHSDSWADAGAIIGLPGHSNS